MVWSKPLQTLAKEFGISDVGLSKICRRHDINTPPQGHWTLVQMGRSPPVAALAVSAAASADQKISISPSQARTPLAAREEIAQMKEAPPAPPPDLPKKPTAALHPVLVATVGALRAASPDRSGTIAAKEEGCLTFLLNIEDAERLIAFLDGLLAALVGRGVEMFVKTGRLNARRGGDDITFTLKGKSETRIYHPTETERAAEEARKRNNARRYSGNAWDTPYQPPVYPERHTVFTGQYSLVVETYVHGVRKTWADAKTQTLESMFHEIVVGIDSCLVAAKAQREEREERWRVIQEEQRRREQRQAYLAREKQRAEFLVELGRQFEDVRRLKAWLTAAPEADAAPHPWPALIGWAQARLKQLERSIDPSTVAALIGRRGLFPEPDLLASAAPAQADGDQRYE